MGGILNSEPFPTTGLELVSPLSLCLMCARARTHTHTHTHTYTLAAKDSHSQLFLIQRTPAPRFFYTSLQQSLRKGLLCFQSTGPPAFQQAVVFLNAFQMDASGLIVYHGTHTQALISPHSFFGHRVSLCFSGHGNLSSKHIL